MENDSSRFGIAQVYNFLFFNGTTITLINEEFYLLGYKDMKSVESKPTFRWNMSPPPSGSKNKPRSAGFLLGVYSSILKAEATCSSETSVCFQRATCRYNPAWEPQILQYWLMMEASCSSHWIHLSNWTRSLHSGLCVWYRSSARKLGRNRSESLHFLTSVSSLCF
jgi:hypothetical protein